MKLLKTSLICAFLMAANVACGNKGPLYLPTDASGPAAATSPTDDQAEATKEDSEEDGA